MSSKKRTLSGTASVPRKKRKSSLETEPTVIGYVNSHKAENNEGPFLSATCIVSGAPRVGVRYHRHSSRCCDVSSGKNGTSIIICAMKWAWHRKYAVI